MSDEARTQEVPASSDVDFDAILNQNAPSTEAGDDEGGESNDQDNGAEQTSQGDAKDGPESQWETRLRGLQAAKDREIAHIRQQAQEAQAAAQRAAQTNQAYENMMLQAAIQGARASGGEEAAQVVMRNYQIAKQQEFMESQYQALQQERQMLQPQAAEMLAYRLSQDPKFKGVDPAQLMEWAPFGPQAMQKAAENLALNQRAANVTARKRSGADRMGSGKGSAGTATESMSGSDLINFALKNSKRSSRWE